MKCAEIEPLLLAERDGVLPTGQRTALADHIAVCPDCRQLQAELAAALAAWKTEVSQVPVPGAHATWATLQPLLSAKKVSPRRKYAPVFWLGAPLAAAAALAVIFLTPEQPPSVPQAKPTVAAVARAEFVEAGNADASTMVYVDKESGWLVVWAVDANSNGKG